MHIIYYVTSHGYGHGVRTVAICNALSPEIRITFRTTLPEGFFREEMRRDFSCAPASFDCGCIQKDSITVAIEQTLATYRAIARKNGSLLQAEVDWCKKQGADLIVSDITPFAFDVAQGCDITSVAVTNFTWYDIYKEYVGFFPDYAPDLEKIRTQYAGATLALALEPSMPMPCFSARQRMPVVGRKGRDCRAELEKKYGINAGRHVGLIYFGHFGIDNIDWKKLAGFTDWVFLGVCELPGAPANYCCVTKSDFPYQDLAASADCMVCKIGYGAVAEAMLHGTPLLYLPRDHFAEYPVLDAAVRSWGGGHPLPRDEFLSLDWKEPLGAVIKNGRPEPVRSDGARLCAEAIEKML